MLNGIVKTPLNYTGNKSRILDQILPLFPKNITRFVDLCCGGASVGLNVLPFSNEVICIDINKDVIDILKTLKLFSENIIVGKIESIIKEFGLSDTHTNGYEAYKNYVKGNDGFKLYNKDGYMKLRDYFNENQLFPYDRAVYLLTLLSYSFNNDIRFNSNGKFNMPIGKTDFNNSIRAKLSSFKQGIKNKNIDFYCAEFGIVKEFGLTESDFVYVDPPYLITNAVYNENGAWAQQQEKELLETLDFLNSLNVKFALSNVLEKEGSKNKILSAWIKRNGFKIININYHYRAASYNKKNRLSNEREVVVLNYDL
jgi:DNA adenine methylase Dam